VIEVVEYTDPGCSWAWGSEPTLRRLAWRFGDRVRWRRVMGGLVGDMRNYVDAFDPTHAAAGFARYWATVSETTGMPYPLHLARMYRSTEPACLAVKAAERQDVAGAVLRRLREATFVFGEPPDDRPSILAALHGVPGLDLDRLAADWSSDATAAGFRSDWQETRAPNEYVRTLDESGPGAGRAKESEGHRRYVFPTVVFRGPRGERTVPGWKPYAAYEAALEAVAPGTTAAPRRAPSPAEAFTIWPALAPRELAVLCGTDVDPPAGVVGYDWGAGTYWLTPAEAEARGLS
jgi:protein-disulfide isomerase-like protein with CxxC motif